MRKLACECDQTRLTIMLGFRERGKPEYPQRQPCSPEPCHNKHRTRLDLHDIDLIFRSADPKCATRVGKLRCPPVTSGAPTPSTVSPTPSTEGISATRSIHPSASVTPSETVCVQTVITKTVSSEVTASVSCPDVCDNYVSSAGKITNIMPATGLCTSRIHSSDELDLLNQCTLSKSNMLITSNYLHKR